MFTLRPLPRYQRRLKKLLHKNPHLVQDVKRALALLSSNPRDPKLKSHKVIADDGRAALSSAVTGDLRIIWRYAEDTLDVIDLVNIGGHSGSKKVYR